MVFSYVCNVLLRLLWSPISSSSWVVLVGSKAGLQFWTKGKRFMFINNKYTQLWGCYSSHHSRFVQVGKEPPYSVGCIYQYICNCYYNEVNCCWTMQGACGILQAPFNNNTIYNSFLDFGFLWVFLKFNFKCLFKIITIKFFFVLICFFNPHF